MYIYSLVVAFPAHLSGTDSVLEHQDCMSNFQYYLCQCYILPLGQIMSLSSSLLLSWPFFPVTIWPLSLDIYKGFLCQSAGLVVGFFVGCCQPAE